ncbi:MAG: hypothetical protein ACJ8F7_04820 [Gemmataceae bacterium]
MNQPGGPLLAKCGVTAYAAAALPLAMADARRTKPGPDGAKSVPLKHVKNADEQTIAGLSALFHAIHARGWQDRSFDDWAVIGAPRYLGRMAVAFTTNKYLSDPAYSISPHIIPNQSLHALSGTISVVLNIHGPNYGVGGGPNAVPEGLLAGLTALATDKLPGVWLVLTEFDPEPIPDEAGNPTNAVTAWAVALALQPENGAGELRLLAEPTTDTQVPLRTLAEYVDNPELRGRPWRCSFSGLGTLELVLN